MEDSLPQDALASEHSHALRSEASFPTPSHTTKLWLIIAVLVALAGSVASVALLFTSFGAYDDEGYMLISLAHYIGQGHLYSQTFSQYGPFYFFAQGIFFQLFHLPVNHDMGRLVTLIYWAGSSLLASVFVFRLSRSAFLACAAAVSFMLAERVLANEPGHPQQVLVLLYALAACLSLPSLSGRNGRRLFLLGCVGAALAFTKLNVGVFYIAGSAHALACLLPSGRIRCVALGLTLIYAAAGPWLLMHASLDRGFIGYWLLATAGGTVAFVCGALARPQTRLTFRTALCSGAGLLATTALIILATSLQGMSIATLISGVVLMPLHQPGLYFIPVDAGWIAWLVFASMAAGLVFLRFSPLLLAESRWLDLLRCAAGIGSILVLTSGHQIRLVLPLLPLTLIQRPGRDVDAAALFPRLFITCMAATQFLEPYPVAGSQIGIASVPMLLWAFLCAADGIAGLQTSQSRSSPVLAQGLRLDMAVGGTLLILLTGAAIALAVHLDQRSAWTSIASGNLRIIDFPPASTNLTGSEWLHLPVEQAARYESIARSASANCSALFTLPGMASFNLWSGVPTPTGWNLTAWMKGISLERQSAILEVMKANTKACAIVDRALLRFWNTDEAAVAGLPLAHYMMMEMPKAADFGEYEIRVHPNRTSSWLPAERLLSK